MFIYYFPIDTRISSYAFNIDGPILICFLNLVKFENLDYNLGIKLIEAIFVS